MAEPRLIDTVGECQAAVAQLETENVIAVDIEGIDLGRQGEVCLIQVYGVSSPSVLLFDVFTMGPDAFDSGGLRRLLESDTVTKRIFDVRADGEALNNYHNAKLRAV
ncbi:unnamed protein product [Prorocentrum cordatum]|uniref:3'-5' exonuclease domain-containing protein n=1 Tax=Prorocentrum cordatum TaxID=2364126 RepID=A0ABN9S812_9DINO|nr:unnamed protein product [Polarella glacialis]